MICQLNVRQNVTVATYAQIIVCVRTNICKADRSTLFYHADTVSKNS